MKTILFGLLILTGFCSCIQQKKEHKLIDITSRIDNSSGFVDLTLNIVDSKETDSSYVYLSKGLYKVDTVGIQISLKKGLKAGIINGEMKNVFVRNGISINSIGLSSNRLLNAMADLYKVDSISKIMRNDLMILTCANLNQQDIDYKLGAYKFKVFMETVDDNPELFVNFDFTNNLVFLNEKDIEYRKGVLKYLMKK
jgi:hypothetical protein